MSVQIAKLKHGCGDKKALAVFAQEDGTVNGWCFACGLFVQDPYGEPKSVGDLPAPVVKSAKEIEEEMAEVSGYPTVDIVARKLRSDSLNKFGAKTSLSEKDGVTPTAIYFPVHKNNKLTGYHVKTLSGHVFNLGDTKDGDLLNWSKASTSGAYTLIITEGPLDMVSVDRIFELYGRDLNYKPAIVSLPYGAGSVKKVLAKQGNDIKRLFKRIVLSFDNDEVGQKAVREAMISLPNALNVTLPAKDANACIMEGLSKAAYTALSFQAAPPKNTSLIMASTLYEAARVAPSYGEWTWPWPKMNKALRGLRWGETIYIGAGFKMGKGEVRNEIIAHLMGFHDAKIFLASFEEPPAKSYKMVNGKLASRVFHDPDKQFDYEAFDRNKELMASNLVLVDRYQRAKWEQVKEDMISAAEWGAKGFFIDPITNFTNGVDPATANTFLQGMAQEASELAADLKIVLFFFCHLKAHDGFISEETRKKKYDMKKYWGLGNCSHQYGGNVTADDFTGSRAMARSCNLMIGIEGNKDPDLPANIRNTRNITVLEDREFGVTGDFPVFWNENTGKFSEI